MAEASAEIHDLIRITSDALGERGDQPCLWAVC